MKTQELLEQFATELQEVNRIFAPGASICRDDVVEGLHRMRAATSTLHSLDCLLAGNPEPKRGD